MTDPASTEERARRSLGSSGDPIYRMVERAVRARHPGGGTLVDVGCGSGLLWPFVRAHFGRYVGVDVVRYDGFPAEGEFIALDLDRGDAPLPDGVADVAAGVETIEHLENPRAFVRMLTRLARPGGWIVVTTPNQHSLLSKTRFVLRGEHAAFTDSSYPAHLTALLEVDLRRMAAECGLVEVAVEYSGRGRVPSTGSHWPAALSRAFPRALSDNLLLMGRKPHG
ncbi:MAG TPA: class I SAM-dependent methyltransferase [Longimicrobium sp.]|jgi:SAM-dependent methyltransferase|uniref:class I SAM-dependent methyltransferase n=1 Tax=Longimicrobium sp. TaxID=2029185 RepID=UPI002ED970C9